MAKIETLINEVADPDLRDRLAREVKELKDTKRFGLVFEEHIPETVSLHGLPIRLGAIVQNRTTPDNLTEYRITEIIDDDMVKMVARGTEEPEFYAEKKDLLVVKRFYEPMFPGFIHNKTINNGPIDKPTHVVINAENYHALEALNYIYKGKIDCVYIDPPYNTGDESWKYNNKFVDSDDKYRHSKWLSHIEKRLLLCKPLLKPDGVIIITIDEHEVHRLGVLVRQIFPNEDNHQMVTIVMGHGTTSPKRMRRVEEYALYIYLGDQSSTVELPYNLLSGKKIEQKRETELWTSLVSSSGQSQPSQRPNMVYPIIIENQHVARVGPSLKARIETGEIDDNSDNLNFFTPPPMKQMHLVLYGQQKKMGAFGLGL